MKFWTQQDTERTPYLDSILPREVRQELSRGRLPLLRCDSLNLAAGETCHYADSAIYEKKIRRLRSAVRARPSGIFRSRDRTAPAAADAVVDIAFEQIDGFLYITSSRVLFSGGDEFWERSLRELLAVKPYLNCVKLQFGREAFKVFVPDGSLPYRALGLLRQAAHQ
ncbi:MAG: hypothetical protein HDQ87_07460 [Clostridia bacterium]|nr:hypothetical protein [Clostridia bacterium]